MQNTHEVWQHTRIVTADRSFTSSVKISSHASRYRAMRKAAALKRCYSLHFTIRLVRPVRPV